MDAPTLVDIPDNDTANSHPRKKHWCFTLFYDEEGVDVRFPDELPTGCTYLVCQRESCPDTGRLHVQGFICWSLAVRFTRAKQLLMALFRTNRSPRIQYIRGSIDDNERYCTKLESRVVGTEPLKLGTKPAGKGRSNGKATARARELILAGKSALEVLSDETASDAWGIALRSAKQWDSLLVQLSPHRDKLVDPTVIVYYGPSRTGKTRLAHDLYPEAYVKPQGKWFLMYKGEKAIIYDDFDGCDMTFSLWKTCLDRYPMIVEPKGGEAKLAATTHIVTTNVWPSHWWSKKVTGRYGRDAIWGRISEIWDFHTSPPTVWCDANEFRRLPENQVLEFEDPKARPE